MRETEVVIVDDVDVVVIADEVYRRFSVVIVEFRQRPKAGHELLFSLSFVTYTLTN